MMIFPSITCRALASSCSCIFPSSCGGGCGSERYFCGVHSKCGANGGRGMALGGKSVGSPVVMLYIFSFKKCSLYETNDSYNAVGNDGGLVVVVTSCLDCKVLQMCQKRKPSPAFSHQSQSFDNRSRRTFCSLRSIVRPFREQRTPHVVFLIVSASSE